MVEIRNGLCIVRDDPLYPAALKEVQDSGKVSIARLQRVLVIGYNRAARMVETMEADGIVSAPDYRGERQVIPPHGARGKGEGGNG